MHKTCFDNFNADLGHSSHRNVPGPSSLVKCYENYDVSHCFVILTNPNNILILSVAACKAGALKHVRKYSHISMKLETYSVTNKLNAQLPHGVAETLRKWQKRTPFIEYQ